MSLNWACTIAAASRVTATAAALTSIGFGIAKASTRLGFSIARDIASATPIPFLNASLVHLENLSLLPILLGESIACTSLVAASTSLDLISNLLEAEDEASFSLSTFVALVRREWAEHEAAGQSITAVARAVAAWAAIQGFTKQWSEDRWLKGVRELTPEDFRPPVTQPRRTQTQGSRRHTVSRVSVTEDVISFGRSEQVISADIGEKEDSLTTNNGYLPRNSSSPHRRSNYEIRKNLRRLSKMVLAGYGGAGLLFFGVPLRPEDPVPLSPRFPMSKKDLPCEIPRTDSEIKNSEEDILVHVVEDAEAEAEAMSPQMRNTELPEEGQAEKHRKEPSHHPESAKSDLNHPSGRSSVYSWWNVLLGKHDREIFEGFAFTPADEHDKDMIRSSFNQSLSLSSQMHNTFQSFSRRDSSFFNASRSTSRDGPRKPKEPRPSTATIGDLSNMPRFWILTDHGRQQVVLIVRGTMSYHELAVDLQCEPEIFEPATVTSQTSFKPPINTLEQKTRKGSDNVSALQNGATDCSVIPFPTVEDDAENIPGSFNVKPTRSRQTKNSYATSVHSILGRRTSIFDMAVEPPCAWPPTSDDGDGTPRYEVHGGMLQLAREMGSHGKPVHEAVCAALARNRGYELILCGHSLGAGIASMLALMWADPLTCRTVLSSGLPSNRRVSVYSFAPPCIASPALSHLCENLITSIVYSFDVVSRLSLGSVRDLNKAAYWLCEAQGEESAVSVLRRALKGQIGFVGGTAGETEEEKHWFIALRKTLEANMQFANLFPPGKVWWLVRDEALHPSHQRDRRGEAVSKGIRLYEVLQVEHVFRQIEFKGDMLSAHLPHQYDRVLAELEI